MLADFGYKGPSVSEHTHEEGGMTRYGRVLGAFGLTVLLVTVATPAAAQPLGTFRWQTQPFCNVLTVAVTGTAAGFRMEGTDDQCGGMPASALGMAYPSRTARSAWG